MAVFASSVEGQGDDAEPDSIWSGVWDGTAWGNLTPVPVPDEFSIARIRSGSAGLGLDRENEPLFALIVDPEDRLLAFTLRGGSWHLRSTATLQSREFKLLTRVAVSPSDGSIVFLQTNIGRAEDGISLRALFRDGDGVMERELYRWQGSLQSRHLEFRRLDESSVAVLTGELDPVLYQGSVDAHLERVPVADRGGNTGDARLVTLPNGALVVVSQERTPPLQQGVHTLSITAADPSAAASNVAYLESPFFEMQSASVVASELLLFGGAAESRGTGPILTSMLLRVPIQCSTHRGSRPTGASP